MAEIEIEKERLTRAFFMQDVIDVAPSLLGKVIVRRMRNGCELRLLINEVEAYRGEEDKGCHCSKGRTARNDVMYHKGGLIYVYLIYGMYWMLNIVTGEEGHPQAVLIRGAGDYNGPGKLTKALEIDKTFYGEDVCHSSRIRIEEGLKTTTYVTTPRIGIDYAGEYWKKKPWRFVLTS